MTTTIDPGDPRATAAADAIHTGDVARLRRSEADDLAGWLVAHGARSAVSTTDRLSPGGRVGDSACARPHAE
jgi:hypothetical protein